MENLHYFEECISKEYKILEFNIGHTKDSGKHANKYKNPYWIVMKNDEKYIIIYCEKDALCVLCEQGYNNILKYENDNNIKITWYKNNDGYICGTNKLFIHQIVTNCYGNGKGTKNISVDHIDRNKLNNTLSNLRIATRKMQENNTKGIIEGTKRERKKSASQLPDGISQEMMPKYVVYYKNWLDKEHTKYREYFRIEKHPKRQSMSDWETSKSQCYTIQEKLQQAINALNCINNDEEPIKPEKRRFKKIQN